MIKTNKRFKRYNLVTENAEPENAAKEMLSGDLPVRCRADWAIQPSIENPNKGLQNTSIKPVPNCE